MSILDQFLADLQREPDNWELRGIIADWAEDNNRPLLAECLRWLIRERKQPYLNWSGAGVWFNAETVREDLGEPESDIPAALFERLEGGKEIGHHKVFLSLGAAEEAFQAAWARARADGWTPP